MKTTKCKECQLKLKKKIDDFINEGIDVGFTLEQIHFFVKYFEVEIKEEVL